MYPQINLAGGFTNPAPVNTAAAPTGVNGFIAPGSPSEQSSFQRVVLAEKFRIAPPVSYFDIFLLTLIYYKCVHRPLSAGLHFFAYVPTKLKDALFIYPPRFPLRHRLQQSYQMNPAPQQEQLHPHSILTMKSKLLEN
jgi:hypothetical protein